MNPSRLWRKAKHGWRARSWFVSRTAEGVRSPWRRLVSFLGTGERVLAILTFHKIGAPSNGGPGSRFYLPVEDFERCLKLLRERGWEGIDARGLVRGLEDPGTLAERTVLLTFDDGYRSVRDFALPCLRRFGFPAVVFVSTDYIGRSNSFDEGIEPEEKICDWDDLRELERNGVSIQSHGVSHRRFSTLGPAEVEEELIRSKEVLESHLGTRVEIFSYPYGHPSPDYGKGVKLLERIGYRAAFLINEGVASLPISDSYGLPRLEMFPGVDLEKQLAGGWTEK